MSEQNITGGRALDDLLQTLPVKTETNIMRSALRAGARVYLDQVKQNIPVQQGFLRASARITTRKGKDGKISASVKVGNQLAFYANMVEFGTRPHVIKARPGGALNVNGSEVKSVDHPGTAPHPFMRPAADAKFSQAVAAVQAQVRKRLTKAGLNVPPADPPDEASE